MSIEVPDWSDAACSGMDTEQWFPVSGNGGSQAKALCWDKCPVRLRCLDWAIQTRQQFGIWGGLSETERAEEVRHRNKRARTSATVELAQRRYQLATKLHRSGLSNKDIAERMQVKVATVAKYIEMAGR